jgi:hypothetical protein
MANMWQSGYWEHFVGFADRTDTDFDASNPDARGGKGEEFKKISADQRTVQGRPEPYEDDDGNSYPGTSNTAKIQYGTNYSEQYGDSISVQEGNKSSIQSQGWSNSVMNGISFSTTLGGSFSSTGGLSIGTHLGLKTAFFGGLEMSVNGAVSVKVAKGGVYTFDTVEKWDTVEQKKELVAKRETFSNKIFDVLYEKQAIGTQFSTVAGKSISQITGEYELLCAGNVDLVSAKDLSAVARNMFFWGMANFEIQSAKVKIISAVATIGGGIIKIG